MRAHTLADVATIELRLVDAGRWSHYTVTNVMSDGTRSPAPGVNTVTQAKDRRREWMPQASIVVYEILTGSPGKQIVSTY